MPSSADDVRFPEGTRREGGEHVKALARRDAAREEERRALAGHEESVGTAHELAARSALVDVRDRLAARQAWVNWIERDY